MLQRNRRDAAPFTAPDGSTIREFLNPRNSPLQNQSLAQASLPPNTATTRHFHPLAEEIYFILSGQGLMEIEGVPFEVGEGDAIPIPSGKKHKIRNTGESQDLVFLCCCAPAYCDEDTILSE
jgi:mannose-6-phosphate isomerase-like protein (cupin superfamily)